MKTGQNGKWLKLKVVKISGQNKKFRQVDNMKSGPNEKCSKWKMVKMESGQNRRWSKWKVAKIKSGQN